MVAYPFHLLECCLVTDGGGALVVTSAERAGSFPKPAVHVLGTGESSETPMISQMADFTESAAFRLAGRAAFAEARIGVADVDHLMIYDAFAHVPIYGLEALGFTAKGEAGAFIAEGNTEPGGSLPLNTNGGGLSYTHTGMYGMFAIQEGVRQLRGEAAAQVGSPQISVILGNGGMFGKGVTKGTQTQLRFLPVPHTDFIFSAFAEEHGFVGVVVVLSLYFVIIMRIVQNAQQAPDRAGMYICMGVAGLFLFHMLVNVGMVVGRMPVTGIPLPFMSAGGSSIWSNFLALGLVNNVRLRRLVN